MALATDPRTIGTIRRQIRALKPGESWCADHPITVDEYLELVPEKINVELVDGVIYMPSLTSYEHESLFSFLFKLLGLFVDTKRLGEVLGSRTGVRTDEFNAPEPDILFVSRRRRRIIEHLIVSGAPDLVIEIIWSKSSRAETMAKIPRFERLGVREIWIIDIPRRVVRVLERTAAGKYRVVFGGGEGIVRSRVVPGFALPVQWLWRRPGRYPPVMQVVQELLAGRVPEM